MLSRRANEIFDIQESECPSCGGQGTVIGISISEDVYKCNQCDLYFLKKSVRPNADNDNHWYEDLRDCSQSLLDKFIKDMGEQYSAQVRVLERLVAGRALLDIGCGLGIFLSIARNGHWNVHGVESSEHAAHFASRYFGVTYSSNFDNFPACSFDVVRISHVLEHIPEPKGFLVKLHHLLKPLGILAIIVPNREPLCAMVVNRLRGTLIQKPQLVGAIYPDMHVLGFSPSALSKLVLPLGFEAIELFTISMGNRTYFPLFYDGLLTRTSIREIPLKSLIKYYLPMIIDNLGNKFGKGQWIVGYYRKTQEA